MTPYIALYGYHYKQQLGSTKSLQNSERVAKIVQATASATSTVATALVTAGSTASAIPVVGWVAAAVAFVASAVVGLVKSQQVAAQLYKQKKDIKAALTEIKNANAQADQVINKLEPEIIQIKSQLGLSGLGATWFEKKFYAGNTAKNALDLTIAQYKTEYPLLERQLAAKIKHIQKMQAELDMLKAKITNQTEVKQAGGIGLGILVVLIAGGLYLKNK